MGAEVGKKVQDFEKSRPRSRSSYPTSDYCKATEMERNRYLLINVTIFAEGSRTLFSHGIGQPRDLSLGFGIDCSM